MSTNYLKTVNVTSDIFTTWQIVMMILGIACVCILAFLAIVIYKYVHRFDWDDELHK